MAEEGQVIGIHKVEEFEEIVKARMESGKLIVVDFTASWCPPCRFIAPVFAELAKLHPTVTFLKVDVDEVNELAKKFQVTAMPTFIFLQKGTKVYEIVGAEKGELGRKVVELKTLEAATSAA